MTGFALRYVGYFVCLVACNLLWYYAMLAAIDDLILHRMVYIMEYSSKIIRPFIYYPSNSILWDIIMLITSFICYIVSCVVFHITACEFKKDFL